MATSRIFANVKITDPRQTEDFVDAMDASAMGPGRMPSAPIIQLVTNIDEIRKFMGAG